MPVGMSAGGSNTFDQRENAATSGNRQQRQRSQLNRNASLGNQQYHNEQPTLESTNNNTNNMNGGRPGSTNNNEPPVG